MSKNTDDSMYTVEDALRFLFSRPGHQMFQGVRFSVKVKTPSGYEGQVLCLLQKSLPPREFVVWPGDSSLMLNEILIVQALEIPKISSRRKGLATEFLKELIALSWKNHQIEGLIIQSASTPAIHGLMRSPKTNMYGKWIFKGEWPSSSIALGDYYFVHPCVSSQNNIV